MDNVEKIFNSLLNNGPFEAPTDYYEKLCNELLADINARMQGDPKSRVSGMRVREKLKTCVIALCYGSDDPADVPIDYIRHSLKFPLYGSDLSSEQAAGINSPVRAIRMMCVNCQSGNVAMVRQCAAINCTLWPFRMGHNPFSGRLDNSEAEALEETEEELNALEALDKKEEPVNADQ
jgi:hypothetical protein